MNTSSPKKFEQRSEISRVRLSFFFFFQAEDGIRDSSVTGVQTCALPISMLITLQVLTVWVRVAEAGVPTLSYVICPDVEHCLRRIGRLRRPALRRIQIGRASCRERV